MKKRKFLLMALLITGSLVNGQETLYKTVKVDGLDIFYREAGSPDSPTILFLHGFPSSSRMFQGLFPLLAGHYHLIAPDYPGFGHSDAPPASAFKYTFDHLADVMAGFAKAISLPACAVYMQDYGGPIGMRLITSGRIEASSVIIQNAVMHEEGLSPLWETRRAFWKDRAANEENLKKNFSSLEATRQRHIGATPHPELIDPDTWTDEYAFLTRPGQPEIQADLFYDYQTNVAAYPSWQYWLQKHRPRMLVVWGKYDLSFTVAGALAYKRDFPTCELELLDAGHFALDEATPEIAQKIREFVK
jgi:pimeloyl-ACP methyl ester carboxylesterase